MDVAARKSKRALPTHVLDKKVTIVTLGLGNFEIGDKSHRKCFAVRNWCRTHSVEQGKQSIRRQFALRANGGRRAC